MTLLREVTLAARSDSARRGRRVVGVDLLALRLAKRAHRPSLRASVTAAVVERDVTPSTEITLLAVGRDPKKQAQARKI
jgi:hypothetical protein